MKEIELCDFKAADMGRPLYEKYGFVKMNNKMNLLG